MSQPTHTNSGKNKIKGAEHGAEVFLDPSWLLNHAAYMPNGEIIEQANMTVGQIIEGIALAHIQARAPHLLENSKIARIEFVNGKFRIIFADDVEHLTLEPVEPRRHRAAGDGLSWRVQC